MVSSRGNRVSISGAAPAQEATKVALTQLYEQARRGHDVDDVAVASAIRLAEGASGAPTGQEDGWHTDTAIQTRRRPILARSPRQAEYIRELRANELVFGLGPAGTGKTFLAVAVGISMLLEGR
ncbi:MAG: hypothetical protein RL477_1311, partial [Pseudomonadota bacterium]